MSWRIKTHDEFIAEFGSLNKVPGAWNSRGHMDYLFGRRLADEDSKKIRELNYYSMYLPREDGSSGDENWSISSSMIIEDNTSPETESSIFPYSFYTEDEMISLYGKEWRREMRVSWMKTMDNLLGKSFTQDEYDKIHNSDHADSIYISRAASPRLYSILSSTSLYIDKRIVNTGKNMLLNDDMFITVDQKY